MEPGTTRKLAIAAAAVAAFFGFVALTKWTSSGDLSEQEKRQLGTFCYVMSSSSQYETLLQTALSSGGEDVLGSGPVADSSVSSFLENTLLDGAPERYRDDAAHLVEGLDRALRGELMPYEYGEYIEDFHSLERKSRGDCEQFDDEPPDFGGGDGGPFSFGSD